jgi:hypothetical protein
MLVCHKLVPTTDVFSSHISVSEFSVPQDLPCSGTKSGTSALPAGKIKAPDTFASDSDSDEVKVPLSVPQHWTSEWLQQSKWRWVLQEIMPQGDDAWKTGRPSLQ